MKNSSTKADRKAKNQPDFVSISDAYFSRIKHYQDDSRQMVWIKLYLNLLDDVDFCLLSDETKFHFLGMLLLAAKMNNRLPNNPNFLGQKLSATSEIDVEILLSKKFLIPFKTLKTKGSSDSKSLSDGYQNACLDKEENRRDKEENRRDKEEKRKDVDAVASTRRDVRGNGDVRAEETRIREIEVSDFYDKFLDYAIENGLTKDAISFNFEIRKGKHNNSIINLVESNKL